MINVNARQALAALTLLGANCVAFAQEQSGRYIGIEDSIGLVHNVHIIVSDQVDGGCWTNVDAIENRLVSKLEQAGIRTYDERLAFYDGFSAMLSVSVVGYRSSTANCVGYLEYDVSKLANSEFNRASGVPVYIESIGVLFGKGQLLSGGVLNDRLLSQVDSWTDELIASIYTKRRDLDVAHLMEAMPNLTEEPLTEAELEEFVRNAVSSE
tara:strand:+ start:723 stop:1355 length:633 start_codon:yes stop_codon:yes gene_type:complete